MYGTTGSGNTLFSASITKKVTSVSFMYKNWYGVETLKDFEFGNPDGSSTQVSGCDSSNCPDSRVVAVTGNLIGMAVKNTF
jgi:hypothetical protein